MSGAEEERSALLQAFDGISNGAARPRPRALPPRLSGAAGRIGDYFKLSAEIGGVVADQVRPPGRPHPLAPPHRADAGRVSGARAPRRPRRPA